MKKTSRHARVVVSLLCFPPLLVAQTVDIRGVVTDSVTGTRIPYANVLLVSTTVALYGVSYGTANVGLIVGENGTILRTSDGGSLWTMQSSGTHNTLRSVWFADSITAIAVGDNMTILRTTDAGITWDTESTGTPTSLFAVSFSDLNRGSIVGEGGTILRTVMSGPIDKVMNDQASNSPLEFSLAQNFPNPFNSTTVITYQLQVTSFVTLKVFDVLGRQVTTLVSEERHPGSYRVDWDGSGSPSGLYFYQLKADMVLRGEAGGFVQTRKMLLLQ